MYMGLDKTAAAVAAAVAANIAVVVLLAAANPAPVPHFFSS